MEIKDYKLNEIKPYEKNPRRNNEAVKYVAKSIEEFGFKVPIIIDKDGVIVCGHTRYKAAKKLKLETVPTIQADDLTEEQIKAFRLADNKVAEKAEWDFDLLGEEIAELVNFDMCDFGFDDLFAEEEQEEKEIVEDEVPDIDEESEPITQLGDIWQLGKHRLMCGDSTDKACIDKLMHGQQADLLLTDPPYGINADKGVSGFGNTKGNKYEDNWDSFTPPKEFFDMILEFPRSAIVFGGNYFTDKLPLGKHWIVWDKVGEIEFQNPYSDCELAWSNIAKESVKKYTVIQQGFVSEEKEKRVHPTQKSVKLFAFIINDYTDKNNIILDVFGGSGTTLMASEQLNRTCYMMELDPKYCDTIIKRWEAYTGQKAEKIA